MNGSHFLIVFELLHPLYGEDLWVIFPKRLNNLNLFSCDISLGLKNGAQQGVAKMRFLVLFKKLFFKLWDDIILCKDLGHGRADFIPD